MALCIPDNSRQLKLLLFTLKLCKTCRQHSIHTRRLFCPGVILKSVNTMKFNLPEFCSSQSQPYCSPKISTTDCDVSFRKVNLDYYRTLENIIQAIPMFWCATTKSTCSISPNKCHCNAFTGWHKEDRLCLW